MVKTQRTNIKALFFIFLGLLAASIFIYFIPNISTIGGNIFSTIGQFFKDLTWSKALRYIVIVADILAVGGILFFFLPDLIEEATGTFINEEKESEKWHNRYKKWTSEYNSSDEVINLIEYAYTNKTTLSNRIRAIFSEFGQSLYSSKANNKKDVMGELSQRRLKMYLQSKDLHDAAKYLTNLETHQLQGVDKLVILQKLPSDSLFVDLSYLDTVNKKENMIRQAIPEASDILLLSREGL